MAEKIVATNNIIMKEKDRASLAVRRFLSQSKEFTEDYIEDRLVKLKLKKLILEGGFEKFTFFWHSSSCFSQWYLSDFTGHGIMYDDESFLEGLPLETTFNCMEQYMMYHKAMLFLDRASARKILDTKSPKEQKQLGRLVQNFEEKVWKEYRSTIVYRGNELKFTQSEKLLSALKATRGTTLVEASPYDKVWGAGLSQKDRRIHDRGKWKGLNLLGEILTTLRVELDSGKY